ncbi:histidine kinase [Pseudomonas sp. Choline-3u-10]|jgi:HPt (histidine-containing phosphotransfer) domain-containing protein|uniref:Hpt domain-containing protein n=2 Tax=Pseudomonadales TaxID=72274 RepID=UPI000C342B1D|nr:MULTISPECIES: Hpt domain-containing protein [Pseudomonadaceae]MAL35861.1 histidine kinase [Pseudomonas sp.]MBU0951097.1 Hpt domain-containing protein [Gammaproteobacteria bacterium]MBK3794967.1 Hpt domain-containing protein [Stutzerimonas stutzeri]MBK3878680.1 Hpt domain-containing protein [Stutzerimonas stutzeri]PKG93823.1 histidine kinase [Pseudomonas sp. Choline-3u-10]|tara:strand:+ start:366 stop:758 length:393 start_codon:yes stop_codon:yes gene_type:complete
MHNPPFTARSISVAEHLDTSVLVTLQEVMEAEYPVLLDTFLVDSEERLRLLQAACRSGEAESLRQAAHSFKGSCSNMGAVLLAELCREMEESARRDQLDEAPGLIERIEREFAIVRILYRAERQRWGGPG